MLLRSWVALFFVACSSPTPSNDAGTSSDAGTDGGTATGGGTGGNGGGGGGGTDAGPGEPTLSSSVLFRDDFDGYADLFALRAEYPEIREVGGVIALEKDGGSGALRVDYFTNDAGACGRSDVHVGKIVSGNVPTVMVTWKFLRPIGFTTCGDAGVEEDFALDRPSTRTTFERSGDLWRVSAGTAVFAQHLRLGTHTPSQLADGAWHRVTLLMTRQTTPSITDGVVQAWVDGALIIDLTGATGTAPFSLATWPGGLWNETVQSRFVDDLAISTP